MYYLHLRIHWNFSKEIPKSRPTPLVTLSLKQLWPGREDRAWLKDQVDQWLKEDHRQDRDQVHQDNQDQMVLQAANQDHKQPKDSNQEAQEVLIEDHPMVHQEPVAIQVKDKCLHQISSRDQDHPVDHHLKVTQANAHLLKEQVTTYLVTDRKSVV